MYMYIRMFVDAHFTPALYIDLTGGGTGPIFSETDLLLSLALFVLPLLLDLLACLRVAKFLPVAQKEVGGAVYSLSNFNGKLLAAVNNCVSLPAAAACARN